MKQLKQTEIKHIREILHKRNDLICPLLGQIIQSEDCTLDHAHQDSVVSETVEGQVRGVIHRFANSLEGSMRAKYVRSGVAKFISFEEFLFNLYNYLMNSREPYLHPTHKPKPRKLMKQSYNKLKKEIEKANRYIKRPIRVPVYPKSKRLTKRLKELFEQFGLEPQYYQR